MATCPKWTAGRVFSVKWEGSKRTSRSTVCDMVQANRDDPGLVRRLRTLKPGRSIMEGGGAAPMVKIRRVK